MRRIAVVIGSCLALGAGFALAGCGGGGESNASEETTTSGAAQQTVTISEKEFSLTPSDVDVSQPETVSFQVKNEGQVAHKLEIEGNGIEEETETIEPGQTATFTVDLSKAGSYEMYCPIDDHEDKGMKGEITVGGSSGSGGMTTTDETTTDDDGPGY